MTQRTAWHCTGCGKTHGPHVDTCPGPADAIGTLRIPNGLPDTTPLRWPYTATSTAGGRLDYNGPETFIINVPRKGLYDALGRN